MTDKPKDPKATPTADQVKDLPPKKLSSQDEENTKGGGPIRRVGGTTDDSI